jgi:hypothetical protein
VTNVKLSHFGTLIAKVTVKTMAKMMRNGIHKRRKPEKLNRTRSSIDPQRNKRSLLDIFATEEHPTRQSNHVVTLFSIIVHRIQRQGDVRMTIVTAQIMLNTEDVIRGFAHLVYQITMRFLYSSEACSTALSH